MEALEALHTRVSIGRLGGEPPAGETLQKICRAALRAPDHAALRPWRFLRLTGSARERLGELFVEATQADEPDAPQAALNKAAGKPLRAPMIIVAIASYHAHDKVPEVEQVISAGAAVQNMLVAAHALGVGAMWRTGGMAYHAVVARGLGLAENESIIGFLYLGEVAGRIKRVPDLRVDDYFSEWN